MDTSPAVFPFRARLLLFVGLVVVAAYALPVSAAAVEAVSNRAENWIVVAYLALVVLFGAMVGALVPRSSTARTRGARCDGPALGSSRRSSRTPSGCYSSPADRTRRHTVTALGRPFRERLYR